jgi:hypothetical protein
MREANEANEGMGRLGFYAAFRTLSFVTFCKNLLSFVSLL